MPNSIVASKPWYSSRTIWLNAVTTSIALVSAIQSQPWVQEYPKVASACVAAVGALTIVLRFVTTSPIE